MISLESYVSRTRQLLRKMYTDGRTVRVAQVGVWLLAGFSLSAASLGGFMMPLGLALVFACSGGSALIVALGSALGYWFFWPTSALQGAVWITLALIGRLITGSPAGRRAGQLLLPAVAALVVAASGVGFQILAGDTTPVGIYLLRLCLAAGASWLFERVLEGRSPVLEWIAWALGILALAQIAPLSYCNLGLLGAGILAVSQAFPAAAMAGLALDLAQVTMVPMTGVLVLAALVRFLPHQPKWLPQLIPALVYIVLMRLRNSWDLSCMPALLLGGVIGTHLPGPGALQHRRGITGVVQVRLEIAAGVLGQTQKLLMDVEQPPVDEDGLVARAADRACGSCPARHSCKDSRRIAQLPGQLLHKPLLHPQELPVVCRKSGRFLMELNRAQEQLRAINADRQRQREYRQALIQQYRFLTEFLQELADRLGDSPRNIQPFYSPQVQVYGNRPQPDNGDRVLQFAGTMCKYYIVLCDGMGTGLGAVQEGKTAAAILRSLLTAGFPPEHALSSLNSLCALRDRAGAVTVDLAQIELYSCRVTLYKWGAAPSYLVSATGVSKLGWASPPQGISAQQETQQVHSLSLRRGQTLLMVSDGVGEDALIQCCTVHTDCAAGELAQNILSCAQVQGQDDATVVTVRLGLGAERA